MSPGRPVELDLASYTFSHTELMFTIRTHVYRALPPQVSRRYGSVRRAELRNGLDDKGGMKKKSGALSARVGTDSAPCRTSPATQACDWVEATRLAS